MVYKIFKDKNNILVLVLIITAVVLGILIYKQKQGTFPNFSLNQNKNISPTVSPNKSSNGNAYAQRRPTPAGLTEEERALLSPPPPNASAQDKGKHFELVKKMAKEASILELNACEKPSPLDLLLKKGQDFEVSNKDSKDHTIIIDRDHQYKIPANSSKKLTADFGRGPGAYGYLCDGLGGVVGFFFVTP